MLRARELLASGAVSVCFGPNLVELPQTILNHFFFRSHLCDQRCGNSSSIDIELRSWSFFVGFFGAATRSDARCFCSTLVVPAFQSGSKNCSRLVSRQVRQSHSSGEKLHLIIKEK